MMAFLVFCEYNADDTPSKWAMRSGLIVILVQKIENVMTDWDMNERVQMVNEPILVKDWMAAKPEWKLVTFG